MSKILLVNNNIQYVGLGEVKIVKNNNQTTDEFYESVVDTTNLNLKRGENILALTIDDAIDLLPKLKNFIETYNKP